MTHRTAVLYARVSTRGQAEEGYSLRQQAEALRAWAKIEGYEVLEEVEDAASGASLERPGLDRVRDLVAAGGVSVVVAQDRDRFSREPAYTYLLRREFEEHGTRLRALNDRGDESPEGELTDGILDQLAKYERAKIAERSRRGKLRKAQEGKVLRGPWPPYGFAYTEDGDGLIVDPERMAVVRDVFRMIGAEGLTMGETQRRLNRSGVPSPMAEDRRRWKEKNSGKWSVSTLGKMVLNPLYRPLTVAEVAASGMVSQEVARSLDPDGLYGLWGWARDLRRPQGKASRPAARPSLRSLSGTRDHRGRWSTRPGSGSGRENGVPLDRRPQVLAAIRRDRQVRGVRQRPLPEGAPAPQRQDRRAGTGVARSGTTAPGLHARALYRAAELEETIWSEVYGLISDPDGSGASTSGHVSGQAPGDARRPRPGGEGPPGGAGEAGAEARRATST